MLSRKQALAVSLLGICTCTIQGMERKLPTDLAAQLMAKADERQKEQKLKESQEQDRALQEWVHTNKPAIILTRIHACTEKLRALDAEKQTLIKQQTTLTELQLKRNTLLHAIAAQKSPIEAEMVSISKQTAPLAQQELTLRSKKKVALPLHEFMAKSAMLEPSLAAYSKNDFELPLIREIEQERQQLIAKSKAAKASLKALGDRLAPFIAQEKPLLDAIAADKSTYDGLMGEIAKKEEQKQGIAQEKDLLITALQHQAQEKKSALHRLRDEIEATRATIAEEKDAKIKIELRTHIAPKEREFNVMEQEVREIEQTILESENTHAKKSWFW